MYLRNLQCRQRRKCNLSFWLFILLTQTVHVTAFSQEVNWFFCSNVVNAAYSKLSETKITLLCLLTLLCKYSKGRKNTCLLHILDGVKNQLQCSKFQISFFCISHVNISDPQTKITFKMGGVCQKKGKMFTLCRLHTLCSWCVITFWAYLVGFVLLYMLVFMMSFKFYFNTCVHCCKTAVY